jgi:hypothetical protein
LLVTALAEVAVCILCSKAPRWEPETYAYVCSTAQRCRELPPPSCNSFNLRRSSGLACGNRSTLSASTAKDSCQWACVRPDWDIFVPTFTAYKAANITSPLAHPRPIPALLRFSTNMDTEHHGHRLRAELLDLWKTKGLPGSKTGAARLDETIDDMRQSVFCLCPPGNTPDTTRLWRALILGCIPVTFFRACEMPFGRYLDIDYQQFTINIQPDDYEETPRILNFVLNDHTTLRSLQRGVLTYQTRFLWDYQVPKGVYANIDAELRHRAV